MNATTIKSTTKSIHISVSEIVLASFTSLLGVAVLLFILCFVWRKFCAKPTRDGAPSRRKACCCCPGASVMHLDTFASRENLPSNSTDLATATTPLVEHPSRAELDRTVIIPASENCQNSCQIRPVAFPKGANARLLEPTVRVESDQDAMAMNLAEGMVKALKPGH